MSRDRDKMARAFRRAFKRSGLSMKKLSEQSETPYYGVWAFFSKCDRDPKLSTLERWATVLNVKIVEG